MGGVVTSLIIPTQRRPAGLQTAVRSAMAQTGVDFSTLELIVVDNDQTPSAQAAVEALAAEAPFPVRYVHEPAAGVANARNAAVSAAQGSLIAFLDDDEEAPPHWLAALLETRARFDADAVFGPVQARLPGSVTRHRAYLERFFSRVGPAETGPMDGYFGCGDSLIRRAAMPDPMRPFSAERNQIGGEDDLLFGHMQARGARFAWAAEAVVWEDPAPERLGLSYTLRRAFAYGQGPSEHCASLNPPDWIGVAKWMAVGLVQAGGYGLLALFKYVTRASDRAFALDRMVRGLGKTFWGGPFKVTFYGRTA